MWSFVTLLYSLTGGREKSPGEHPQGVRDSDTGGGETPHPGARDTPRVEDPWHPGDRDVPKQKKSLPAR